MRVFEIGGGGKEIYQHETSVVKKEIKRIEWRIVERIILLLYGQDRMKKTHIAAKGNLGYDKCQLYLEWMEMLDLVKKEVSEEGSEVIRLTRKSHELYDKNLSSKLN